MQEINICEYIKSGNILNNLKEKNPFDIILYEKLPEKEKIKDFGDKIQEISSSKLDFSVWWELMWISEKYENILIIIDSLNIVYLTPFIQKFRNKNFTIINLNTWISSYINKLMEESNDISLLQNYEINIKEPADFIGFFQNLLNWEKNYIRIANKNLVWSIATWAEDWINLKEKIISLREFWLTGENWTILIWSSMIWEIVQSTAMLRDKDLFFDVFAINDYSFEWNEELAESLKTTEKLILVLDQQETKWLEQKIKSILFDLQLWDTEIHIVKPDEKIDAITKEFLEENLNFSWDWIANKILEKLN